MMPLHMDRRTMLAGSLALAAAQAARAQAPEFTTGAIDVHHHFLPPFYKPQARAWLDRFATGVDAVLAWTPQASLAAMDAARVDRAILSISAPGVHFGDAGRAARLARDCNDYASALAQAHSGRFGFFAALPMPDTAAAIREADRALALPGCKGIGLLSNYNGRYLGEARFAPLFAWLERRKAIVYVHPTDAPCCAGLVPGLATPLIEFPVDTGRTIASLLWSGTLSACPSVRFIFSHGGGVLPMVAERVMAMGYVDRALLAKVPEGPAKALARLYVDTASVTMPGAMAALSASLPEQQILYGTDFPWGGLASSRAALGRLGLTRARLDAIEAGNARRLFAD